MTVQVFQEKRESFIGCMCTLNDALLQNMHYPVISNIVLLKVFD